MYKDKRVNRRLLKWHINHLKTKGIKISDDLYIYTGDYDLKNIFELPIKDVANYNLDKYKDDKEYYKTNKDIVAYKDIKRTDILYGDWWKVLYQNNVYFITISTPYVYEINNFSIKDTINKHFHSVFGYESKNPLRFIKAKNCNKKSKCNFFELTHKYNMPTSSDKITEYFKNISKDKLHEYTDYLQSFNDSSIQLKEYFTNFKNEYNENWISIINNKKHKAIHLSITIPLFTELSYKSLFKNIFINNEWNESNDINIYDEDYIENLFNNEIKNIDFLKEFKEDEIFKITEYRKNKFKNKVTKDKN